MTNRVEIQLTDGAVHTYNDVSEGSLLALVSAYAGRRGELMMLSESGLSTWQWREVEAVRLVHAFQIRLRCVDPAAADQVAGWLRDSGITNATIDPSVVESWSDVSAVLSARMVEQLADTAAERGWATPDEVAAMRALLDGAS